MSGVSDNRMMAKLMEIAAAHLNRADVFEMAYKQFAPAVREIAAGVFYNRNKNVPARSADRQDFCDDAPWDVLVRYKALKPQAREAIAPAWRNWVCGALGRELTNRCRKQKSQRRLMDYWNCKLNESTHAAYGFKSIEGYHKWTRRLPLRPTLVHRDCLAEVTEEFEGYLKAIGQALLTMRRPAHSLVVCCEFGLSIWLDKNMMAELAGRARRRLDQVERLDRPDLEQDLRISPANWNQIICRFRRTVSDQAGRRAA